MNEPEDPLVFRVKAGSDARRVGSALAHSVIENKNVLLRAIGAGPINQAQKAVAIANQWTAPKGIFLATIPGFADVPGKDGETISAMTFLVVKVKPGV